MPIGSNIIAGASGQSTGSYAIDQSLRVEDADGYLTKTFGSAGNRKTWTYSVWCKKALIDNAMYLFASDYSDSTNFFLMNLRASNATASKDYTLSIQWRISESTTRNLHTTQKFRDPSAWYHIVLVCDTTQASASDRLKLYVNGEQVTDFATDERSNISQNADTAINRAAGHQIGAWNNTSEAGGYYAEVNFIDGTALTPASFGETNADTNQWVPIKYAGSYGTNGFYLKFQDSSALGDDSSGNTNDFTTTNLAATDQVLDSPTNNFATLNPLAPPRASGSFTYSEGNLKVSMGGSGDADCPSTIGASSGKWYAEAYILTGDQSTNTPFVGLVSSKFLDDETIASSSNSCVYYYSGSKRVNGTVSSYGATYNAGDIVGIAFNADDNEVTFYKNNSTQGAISLTADEYVFSSGKSAGTPVLVWNFGQDSSFAGNKTSGAAGSDFYYTPPTGFKALNTDNLPDPSIADPTAYFNTVLYTGNDSSQSITNGLQADFLWFKSRDQARGHALYDSVRGPTKGLQSDSTAAEATASVSNDLVSFDSDGFTLGPRQNFASVNASGDSIVTWGWKAGGTASSNTDGTITSSVSANTDAGFSIVSYTGTGTAGDTLGHGLSQAPEMVIMKKRESNGADGLRGWHVWSKDLTDGNYLALNGTNAQFGARDFGEVGSGTYPYTEPTASTIYLGGSATGQYQEVNYSGDTYIMYCFHSVDGYSKVGSYQGNGNNDGPFIFTGFQVSFFLVKKYETVGGDNWAIYDNKRNETNVMNTQIYPDSSSTEESSSARNIDFVSNGIKIRGTNSRTNDASTHSFVYLAFAEFPFKTSNAR